MSLERINLTDPTPWIGEHLHRYLEACKYIDKQSITLDLACGSGYGTSLISEKSNNIVFGGDIDKETILLCKKNWIDNKKLCFEIMDGTNLNFENDFFDNVISLETIEHLVDYDKMISEFSRVIKKSGCAIISTPNIKVASPGGVVRNPYHTQEFNYSELEVILNKYFSDVKIYGQMYTRYFEGFNRAQYFLERLLLQKGIRKIPYFLRNKFFKCFFKEELYPTSNSYQLFSDNNFINANCHVLFAVCKK